jgi:hemolysin activation/secretion protein
VSDRGWTLEGEIEGYPGALSTTGTFGTARAVVAAYVPIAPNKTHLAFRAGGSIASESTPLQHAPFLGGGSTLRGYTTRRYAGDQAAYGSAEIRIPAGTLPFLIKWKMGVFGLADVGRVWLDGDSPGGWHKGYGGGIWLSALGQAFSVAYAHGEENRFYIQKGLFF